MTLACGCDNRMVDENGGYTTKFNARDECEWHPPPALDHGQAQVNYHHRPELLRYPPQAGSEWADRIGQLDRLLDPAAYPPEDASVDRCDDAGWSEHDGWPEKDGDDLTEERLLGQFRAVTADIDFWELVTGDHHHGGTGLRGP